MKLDRRRSRGSPSERDNRQRDNRQRDIGQPDSADADAAQLDELGYEPNVNQVRHEPMPASRQADQRQEAVERNEQFGGGSGRAWPANEG